MLIRKEHLDGIVGGEVTLAFRAWKRPTVKAGGTLHTVVGLIAIDAVEQVAASAITALAARRAGYSSASALKAELRTDGDRTLHRIKLHFQGEDPRIALRRSDKLSAAELTELTARVQRFDDSSRRGPWTGATLRAIRDRPATLAATLASLLDMERAWFKGNVRKLKALGLTESLEIGYRLSPRGVVFLRAQGKEPRKKA